MKLTLFKIKFSLLDFVFIICLFSVIFLRFYHFEQTYNWGSDNVRDFLVAKHIVEYHDFQWISPWAAGSQNYLANSVFYYYFLAIFYFFSSGQVLYYQLIVAIFSMLIVIIYAHLFGKLLFKDKIMRYGVVLLFCLLPPINLYGRSVFQPHFVVPFLMMSFYYFLAAFHQKSIKKLSLAVISYFFAFNMHYSTLIMLPWVLGVTVYLQYQISNTQKFRFKSFLLSQLNSPSLIIFLGFCFLIFNQSMIKGIDRGLLFFSAFFNKIFVINSHLHFKNMMNNLTVLTSNIVGNSEFNFAVFLLCLSIFLIFVLFFLKKKTFYSLSLFSIFLFLPFVFLVVHSDFNLPENYFVVFYLVLPFFITSVLASLNKKLSYVLFFIVLSSFTFLSIKQFNNFRFSSNRKVIEKYNLSAIAIGEDAKLNLTNPSDFFIFVIDNQLDWSSPAFWFYLEKNLNLQLVKNSQYKYNVVSNRETSKNIYLICDNSNVTWNKGKENWCLERFTKVRVLKSQEKIFSIEEQNLSIYRLLLNTAVTNVGIYSLISIGFN